MPSLPTSSQAGARVPAVPAAIAPASMPTTHSCAAARALQAPECNKPDSLSRIRLGVCAMDKKVRRPASSVRAAGSCRPTGAPA